MENNWLTIKCKKILKFILLILLKKFYFLYKLKKYKMFFCLLDLITIFLCVLHKCHGRYRYLLIEIDNDLEVIAISSRNNSESDCDYLNYKALTFKMIIYLHHHFWELKKDVFKSFQYLGNHTSVACN